MDDVMRYKAKLVYEFHALEVAYEAYKSSRKFRFTGTGVLPDGIIDEHEETEHRWGLVMAKKLELRENYIYFADFVEPFDAIYSCAKDVVPFEKACEIYLQGNHLSVEDRIMKEADQIKAQLTRIKLPRSNS